MCLIVYVCAEQGRFSSILNSLRLAPVKASEARTLLESYKVPQHPDLISYRQFVLDVDPSVLQ